jgi:hypothetical protein
MIKSSRLRFLSFQSESAALFITGGLAVILALAMVSARSRDDNLLMAGYRHLWSGRGPASADFREALRRDPASPYRWTDLAEALLHENNISGAQYCISQAIFLGPNVPAILLRAVNVEWLIGKPDLALTYSRHILDVTAHFDSLVFRSYDRMGLTMEQVLNRGLSGGGRPAQSYFRYLLVTNRMANLKAAWRWMSEHALADERLARDYTGYLFARQMYPEAADAWRAYAHAIPNGYSGSGLVFNGDFERELSGSVLDWQITPANQVEARQSSDMVYSGSKSLQIRFNGSDPVEYRNISQSIVPPRAGEYRFEAQVRTQALDCEEGLRFRIFDAEAPALLTILTAPVTGTTGWTRIQHSISIPAQTRVLRIEAILRPSPCAATKVFGNAWIDAVKLDAVKFIPQP